MFFIIFLLFVLIPVIELSVLIRVGEVLGTWTTIGLVLFTAVLGVSLVRSQGLSTLMQVQQKLARGEAPGQEIVEGMMLAMAGILLVIPGFVTDAIGLLLLTPFTRRPIAALLFKRMWRGYRAECTVAFKRAKVPLGLSRRTHLAKRRLMIA